MPNTKSEQFNHANLHKLYNKEILWSSEPNAKHYLADLEPFEQVAFKKNTLLFNDGMVYPSNDLGIKKPFQLQILDQIKVNRNKQDEYVKLIRKTENFSNFTYAFSPFLNTVIVPSGANENFMKNPISIQYLNKNSKGILECNTNIIDIQYKTKVHLKENVKLQSGQMNNIIYIVRENSELVIDRITNDYGGFGIFDSKFICHPNSKITINFKNTGSDYYQENFYFDLTTNVDLTLNGIYNIYKGHEYHEFVHVVRPRLDFDPDKKDKKNMPFQSIYMEYETGHIISVGGFKENPYVIPRYLKASTETYGRSPGMNALPDVKVLNKRVENALKAAAKQIDRPLLIPDDGMIAPVRMSPGSINYYRAGSRDRIETLQIGQATSTTLNNENL